MNFAPQQVVRALFDITDDVTKQVFPKGKIGVVTTVQDSFVLLVWVSTAHAVDPVMCFAGELEQITEAQP